MSKMCGNTEYCSCYGVETNEVVRNTASCLKPWLVICFVLTPIQGTSSLHPNFPEKHPAGFRTTDSDVGGGTPQHPAVLDLVILWQIPLLISGTPQPLWLFAEWSGNVHCLFQTQEKGSLVTLNSSPAWLQMPVETPSALELLCILCQQHLFLRVTWKWILEERNRIDEVTSPNQCIDVLKP